MKPTEAMVLTAGKGSRLFRSPTTIAVFLGNLIVISRGFIQDSSPSVPIGPSVGEEPDLERRATGRGQEIKRRKGIWLRKQTGEMPSLISQTNDHSDSAFHSCCAGAR
jgi:hypothetical protein